MWACEPALTSTILGSYQAAGPLFVQALETFFAAHCALVGDHVWPADATDALLEDPNYDFIVVGAGSAGSVVANRLSEVPEWKVLLVEAGGNPTLGTEAPQLAYSNVGTTEDWNYRPEPQEGACRAYKGQQCTWPRGKTLGGCSSINFMFYIRGNKLDYNEWAADGNYGWDYDSILPYFKKSENFTGPIDDNNVKYHGTGGYLHVEKTPIHPLESLILKAASETGIEVKEDLNTENQIGIAKSYTTTKNGIRQSTARAFLNPLKNRPNLHVVKNALATKVLFKPSSNIVNGIIIKKDGQDIVVKAKKEVILSGGAINSPHLLLLSGIGPQKHLKDVDIDVVADIPVGENLQEHVFSVIFFKAPTDENQSGFTSKENIVKHFSEFVLQQSGIFADVSPHLITAFVNTTDSAATSPDMQYHYLFFPPGINNVIDMFRKHNLNDEFCDYMADMNKENTILVVYSTVLQPKSKGRILLKSKNPQEHPLIYANFFDNYDDMRTLIKGMKQSMELGKTKAFKDAGFEIMWPKLKTCDRYVQGTDEYLECYARELTFSLYHPTSTTRMGPDNDKSAVVNPELKVRKIKGLRVIDASIMPKVLRGNTNAPTIMIGEKGADLIKKDWLHNHSEL
ncbi:glucose dehydrogenase [FAD, quinone]-like [Leguminivora glycinivorella]|uniref:glucose dehydrogenase [FAD, quinone]-like n=1 Tax=Leguminivora glycinivorella TaxID=1035111 RepID=UPI00200D27CB|nr:glucose dehydrogenase [FAD, quinone]-like [Leguminivora glycinivorella]